MAANKKIMQSILHDFFLSLLQQFSDQRRGCRSDQDAGSGLNDIARNAAQPDDP